MHQLVSLLQGVRVQVERIGVLHEEFPGPHDAEPGTDLITELGLDLIEVDRQLFVAAQLVACQFGDDLFVGGTVAELPLMPVVEAQQLRAIFVPAPRFLPEFCGLHRRHQHLQGTGPVHLLPHDDFHLAQHPQPQGQPGIEAGGQLADHAAAQHQPMADGFGIGRGLLDGIQRELGGTHGQARLW